MKNWIGRFALACACITFPATALAYDEAMSPDLSSLPTAPTPLTFVVGNNQVKGTVNSSSDIRDYITFTIPAGQRLTAIRMMSYTNNPDNGNPGNTGFHAINVGATSLIPDTTTENSFLGGDHVIGPIASGTDLMAAPGLADGVPAGTGFTPPLGAGTYSYVIQNTSGSVAYDLQFVVALATTPVPVANGWMGAALAGVLATIGFVAVRRRAVLRSS